MSKSDATISTTNSFIMVFILIFFATVTITKELSVTEIAKTGASIVVITKTVARFIAPVHLLYLSNIQSPFSVVPNSVFKCSWLIILDDLCVLLTGGGIESNAIFLILISLRTDQFNVSVGH